MSKVIGYTTGVFDLFHIGHLNILRRAKGECDHLVVGITTDELCEMRKGRKPIICYAERVEIVKSVRYVDEVVPQASMNKMDAWQNLKFNKVFVGNDWKGTPEWTALEKAFAAVGVAIVYFPYTNHTSSTILRRVLETIYGKV